MWKKIDCRLWILVKRFEYLMSYKDYVISSLSKLYSRYESADNCVSKRLLMHKIKCYLSDLNKIEYEENYNYSNCGCNDL